MVEQPKNVRVAMIGAGSGELYVFGGFQAKNRGFIDCVKAGRRPGSCFADAVKTMEVVATILAQSMLCGR